MSSIAIQVTHDFTCPWCAIGESNLRRGIAESGVRGPVIVTYRAFEVDPSLPDAGADRTAYRVHRLGSLTRARQADADVELAGRRAGVAFDFDRNSIMPNTRLAHRLLDFAATAGDGDRAGALSSAIFDAYFARGLDIGDRGVLLRLAAQTGFEPHAVDTYLASDAGVAAVRQSRADALHDGIRLLPAFAIGAERISGAQPATVFARALRAAARHDPQPNAIRLTEAHS
ncbi:DsbA family oxidoreductase [Burkholderia oklahomensis]|uniref:DSBA-like thioredoxin domain protein n=1 Tax=Burkholderia oklahomensis TaxID=342113 RepID=A0AAI8BB20_9BURK|nr:DsbA family oxidoreductase [Burkholderia oklahomensis]AIO69007.1 DSBA-like thioredoxin domain protein [Burkholderia oklahomensis]AOI39970.1 disulfide bond formation protein DsbA [Burkholderia oklahomensis EO147]KUY62132.1 disulfide bond formation protein DsbA [Burkholderia oklahomensis EO147]QPS39668.1 DsbA family oxidoreductase [Burkholderia oklahomensis]